MIETEDKKALAHAYRVMAGSEAWRELERYLLNEKELSMKRVDDKPARDLVIGEVCEERGLRKGILKILRHVEEMKEGL